jgi:predicted nucleic acid-binding protein
MKRYLLDTGPLAAFLLGRTNSVQTITPWLVDREVATSIIDHGEIEEYIKQMSNYAALHSILIRQLEEIKPLSITRHIMDIYADIRRQMRAPYGAGLMPDSDTLIAATALRYNLTLMTGDERDFKRVPGLKTMLLTSR